MQIFLVVVAATVAVPALVLGVECVLAVLPRRRTSPLETERPSIAVLVPAHNEQDYITTTIQSLRSQLSDADRLLVIADNCTDATAHRARAAGAEVLERTSETERGKGFALRFGLHALRSAPPEVVLMFDADCQAEEGAIDLLARVAHTRQRPIQSAYLMHPPADGQLSTLSAVSAFAVLIKNFVRPLGLQRLGLPCLLTGSGMAFPWKVLDAVPQPGSHIVEDMHYSTDLALAGYAPLPAMDARVHALLPSAKSAFVTQRTRWEHGHLSVISSQAPRLFVGALRRFSPALFALMLELSVPPLSLLVCLLMAITPVVGVASWAVGTRIPLFVLLAAGLFAGGGLAIAWLRYATHLLTLRQVLSIPLYVLKKLPLYGKFVTAQETTWVRTARSTTIANEPPAPHFAGSNSPKAPSSNSAKT